jgi:hypothetical protein
VKDCSPWVAWAVQDSTRGGSNGQKSTSKASQFVRAGCSPADLGRGAHASVFSRYAYGEADSVFFTIEHIACVDT